MSTITTGVRAPARTAALRAADGVIAEYIHSLAGAAAKPAALTSVSGRVTTTSPAGLLTSEGWARRGDDDRRRARRGPRTRRCQPAAASAAAP